MGMREDFKNIYKFRKNEIRRFEFYINKERTELLEWFNAIPNKQGFILELLERERKRGKKVQKS